MTLNLTSKQAPSIVRGAFVVSGFYLAFAVVWIMTSDHLVQAMARTVEAATVMQSIKGLVFVTLSALLIFALSAMALRHQQRAEDARARAMRRLALLVETTSDGVWEYDLIDGSIQWNDRWTEHTGHAPEAASTVEWFRELVHRDDLDRVKDAFAAFVEGGGTGTYACDYRIRAADGRWTWQRARARTVDFLPDGRPRRVMGAFTDLTAIKENERRLEAAVEDLRRSEQELERFAHATAHDLRQPVRQMASYAQLLGRHVPANDLAPAEVVEYTHFIVDGSRRLSETLDAMLTAFEQRSRASSFAVVDMEALIRRTMTKLAPRIEAAGAEVVVGTMPVVRGDPVQLALLVDHLLSNALKFHAEGEVPQVSVTAELAERRWTLRVADRGIGLPDGAEDRVFEAFVKLHADDRYPGSGMGLALCRSIARHHGGDIRVERPSGGGTVFAVDLPRAPQMVDRSVA